jgi:hypothetical protein
MPVEPQIALPAPDSDDEFDVLVEHALKAKHSKPFLQRFGRSGQGQHGIDGWDPLESRGLVWQATIQKDKLLRKLEEDLALFDDGPHRDRAPFIFVVAAARDAKLQLDVNELCQARLGAGKSPVMVEFWSDLQRHLPDSVRQAQYPNHSWNPPAPAIGTGFAAIGGAVVVHARLVGQGQHEWSLELGEFVRGTAANLSAYLERFDGVPAHERYIIFEGLGVARPLASAPRWEGKNLHASLLPRAPRTSVHDAGEDIELTEDGDMALDGRLISGFAAALQLMSTTMSFRLGEWSPNPLLGTRCAAYFREGYSTALLGRLFALELARIAAMEIGNEGVALPFVDRVVAIEIPSLDLKKGWLFTSVRAHLHEFGEWEGPLRVHVGDTEPESNLDAKLAG